MKTADDVKDMAANSPLGVWLKQLLGDYHFALDMRQNANASAFHLIRQIETLYEMPYEQGAEERRRVMNARQLQNLEAMQKAQDVRK